MGSITFELKLESASSEDKILSDREEEEVLVRLIKEHVDDVDIVVTAKVIDRRIGLSEETYPNRPGDSMIKDLVDKLQAIRNSSLWKTEEGITEGKSKKACEDVYLIAQAALKDAEAFFENKALIEGVHVNALEILSKTRTVYERYINKNIYPTFEDYVKEDEGYKMAKAVCILLGFR